VKPGSVVIVGDSRPLFDCDLEELERGLGTRPIQLAQAGGCAFPCSRSLANDETFHGTIICSIVPLMFFAPGGPLVENAEKAVKRYHTQTLAQRASQFLAIPLEEHVAFLKQEELDTKGNPEAVADPKSTRSARAAAFSPSSLRSIASAARMTDSCAQPGRLNVFRDGWFPLFTPPPPPTYVPREAFVARMEGREGGPLS
jgi:hypothetical protein